MLHERFGVTDPDVFRIVSQSALGVEDVKAPPTRFTSLAYVQQASALTPVRHEATPHAAPLLGESCSLDFTRTFVRDMDGHTCAAIMLDISTYSLWIFPLKSKPGTEAARAVVAYRAHVRIRYGR